MAGGHRCLVALHSTGNMPKTRISCLQNNPLDTCQKQLLFFFFFSLNIMQTATVKKKKNSSSSKFCNMYKLESLLI